MSEIDITIITVSDLNNDVISIAFTGLPDFVSVDNTTQNTSTLFVSPTLESSGGYGITVTATDSGDRIDTENFRLNITNYIPPDSTPPMITLTPPTIMTVEVDSTFTDPGYVATDDVDGDITFDVVVTGTVDTNVIGTYYLYYDVSDSSDNVADTITRIIHVVDTTPPNIISPANQIFEATGLLTPLTSLDYDVASVTDNYDPSPEIINDAPEEFTLGDTTITYTATDVRNNNATAIQIITVQDRTEPLLIAPDDITILLGYDTTPANTGMATATDLVDDTPTITHTDNITSFSQIDVETITRTWSATDFSNNTSSGMQIITITEETPLQVTISAEPESGIVPLDI